MAGVNRILVAVTKKTNFVADVETVKQGFLGRLLQKYLIYIMRIYREIITFDFEFYR